jgi:branched-chain amino acid transport system ATP-binding protein
VAILEVKGLAAGYGNIQVLFDINLTVEQGELAVLIGPNGAGKSTTLGVLAGLIEPRQGQILFQGQDAGGRSARENVRLGICLVPEGRRVFPDLSVEDNLRVAQWAAGRRQEGIGAVREMYDIFGRLGERRRQLAGTMSGGEQQMLAIARALVARPKLLLVDESSMGLAPKVAHEVLVVLKHLADQGISVLAVEQNAQVLDYADAAFVLEQGHIEHSARGADVLMIRELAVQAYLGTSTDGRKPRPESTEGRQQWNLHSATSRSAKAIRRRWQASQFRRRSVLQPSCMRLE